MMHQPDKRVWKSFVWHEDDCQSPSLPAKCIFVSTIERDYDIMAAGGTIRGMETLVWEFDWKKDERGKLLGQGGGLDDHHAICRCFVATGEMFDENKPEHERFTK